MTQLPGHVNTIIAGGGTSGAALAGTLAATSDETILVLEAGPDFGARESGAWPADLLDARGLAGSCDWGYDSGATFANRVLPFARARVIGGCSSHNGCAAIVGSRLDYDGWGAPGWSTDTLRPLFAAAMQTLRVHDYAPEEITPFQQVFLDAAPAVGLPVVTDLNDWDDDEGIAPSPVNVAGGIRWNTAFAYLDPVRGRPGLTIAGDAPVTRLILEGGRATAVEVLCDGRLQQIGCDRVVVAGGAYGSPGVLERSGIGDPEVLRAAGVAPLIDLPAVGEHLHDHPAIKLTYAGGPGAEAAMTSFGESHYLPEEQVIAKVRSRHCTEGFDIHIYPVAGNAPDGEWWWEVSVACLTPQSRGHVHIRTADVADAPRIDHAYCTDPAGADRAVLTDAVRIARELASAEPARSFLGAETNALPAAELFDDRLEHYYHPVGSCSMGPVVDPELRVHGLANVRVADCSVMPVVPRGNTNVPAVVAGLRAAQLLADSAT